MLHPGLFILGSISDVSRLALPEIFRTAFSITHLPMAFYFAILGLILGIVHAIYLNRIITQSEKIKIMESILPICAKCKRIRKKDASGELPEDWTQIESFIAERSKTKFSHTFCPECARKLYPELDVDTEEGQDILSSK